MMSRWTAPRLPRYSADQKLKKAMRSVRRSIRRFGTALTASMGEATTAVARFNIALAAAFRTATARLRLENDGYETESPPGPEPSNNT